MSGRFDFFGHLIGVTLRPLPMARRAEPGVHVVGRCCLHTLPPVTANFIGAYSWM